MAEKYASDNIEAAMARNPHLRAYVEDFMKKVGKFPEFYPQLTRDMKDIKYPNLIYPVGDPVFIHIYGDMNTEKRYVVIEPRITGPAEEAKYDILKDKILELAPEKKIPEEDEAFEQFLDDLVDEAIERLSSGFLSKNKVTFSPYEVAKFRYLLKRDIVGIGPLEPLMMDPYIEDIHIIGANYVSLIHKIFEAMETNITFGDNLKLADYFKNLSERMGRPVSDKNPIVDGTLPNGSRINIIYSPDVSIQGPSATIRKFTATPISVVQLVKWGTFSAQVAA